MACKFKAGETYRTRDGREARVYATDGCSGLPIHGAVWNKCWEPYEWRADGAFGDKPHSADLMPPKREVWVAVWRSKDTGTLRADFASSPAVAADMMDHPYRESIAVLGPVEIEDPQ